MTSMQFFSWQISDYFRTLTGNIFLGVFFVKLEILNCRLLTLEKRDRSPKTFLNMPKFQTILSFLSGSMKSICDKVFNPIGFRMQSCNFIQKELYYIHFSGYFPKILVQQFQNTLMRASVMAFRRALGCRLCLRRQFCVFLKRDSTRDSFL